MEPIRKLHELEAVEMIADWEYNVDTLPGIFRDGFPREFVNSEGITKLSKGEQGWRMQTSPDGSFSMCQFPRGPSHLPTFKIPTNHLSVGVKANVKTIRPTLQATSIPEIGGTTPLHRFIRTFWSIARNERTTLASLGLWTDRLRRLFDDATFRQNVDAVINALTPEALALLSDPSPATLETDMIRDLRRVTTATKGPKMCYLRMYSQQPEPSDPGARMGPGLYIGTTDRPGQRQETHERDTEYADLHHYRIARKSPPPARRMFVLMNLDGFDEDLTAMAEETFIAVFGAYANWHFVDRDDQNQVWLRESQRAKTMAVIAQRACVPSGFSRIGADMRANGCNVHSPLFHTIQAGRAWLHQSLPGTPYQPPIERYSSPFVFPSHWVREQDDKKTAQPWFSTKFNFKFNKAFIEGGNLEPGMICNLVIEVTSDKRPHPKPYVKLPTIGLYENFGEVSSVAIFVESHKREQGKWYQTQIFHQRPSNAIKKGVYVPEPYFQVKRILQLLEGTIWAETNEHFKDQGLTVRSMEHVKVDHLKQTIEFVNVPFPQAETTPLPRRMTYEHNAALMFEQHADIAIGPSQRPTQQERNVAGFAGQAKLKRNIPENSCDACWWHNHFQPKSAIKRCTGPDTRQCDHCMMYYGRPCTFTERELLTKWLADGDPEHLFITKPDRDFIHQEINEPFGGQRLVEEYAAQMNELNEVRSQEAED